MDGGGCSDGSPCQDSTYVLDPARSWVLTVTYGTIAGM